MQQAPVPQLVPYAVPMPVPQPMVQPVVQQQVQITQPVQVEVVEKPVVKYVDKYVNMPAPPPRVEHHTEVVYVQGPGGYAGYEHGGYPGHEYGGYPGHEYGGYVNHYAGYSAGYDTSGYGFAEAAPAYPMPSTQGRPMPSTQPRTPRSFSDPSIPAPMRLPDSWDAFHAGGYQVPATLPSTPRSRAGFGGGTYTPKSAKQGLPYSGSQDQPYRLTF